MNITSNRDGLEVIHSQQIWTLYLVEDDGKKYSALATMHDHDAVNRLFAYLAHDPRRPRNDNRRGQAR